MAIILRKSGRKIYASSSGAVTNKDKERADKLDKELEKKIQSLEQSWLERRFLTSNGTKKETLRVWYELGEALNKISKKYNIKGSTEEPLYWLSIYDHVSPLIQRKKPPKTSRQLTRNHFRLCGIMAQRGWSEVKQVGPWSVWRDLFDNSKLLEDKRVFDWVVKKIRVSRMGHKELRPFIHASRRRIAKIDSSVLSNKELRQKLEQIKY